VSTKANTINQQVFQRSGTNVTAFGLVDQPWVILFDGAARGSGLALGVRGGRLTRGFSTGRKVRHRIVALVASHDRPPRLYAIFG
jgi:hypothetical protein